VNDNDYLKKLIKSKKEKNKSPLEKFINKEDTVIEKKTPAVNKPDVEIEHYGGSTQTTDIKYNKPPESQETEPTSPKKPSGENPPDSLLKASGLREFDIDALDIDSTEEITNKSVSTPTNENSATRNSVNVTEDEINQLIGFVKTGNFDAAVDFIVQLKLKYNIDNIL